MATGDKIPDPRDRAVDAQPYVAPDDLHPTSLAAFEDWCRQTQARSTLRMIEQYRRTIDNQKSR